MKFNYLTDSQRNLWLAGFSQMFSAPILRITAKIGVLVEAESGVITQTFVNAMQVLGLILLALVFMVGYFVKQKKLYNS